MYAPEKTYTIASWFAYNGHSKAWQTGFRASAAGETLAHHPEIATEKEKGDFAAGFDYEQNAPIQAA